MISKWDQGAAHLVQADPRWVPVLDRFGPCPLVPAPDRLASLARAIVGQQISSAAATSIYARLVAACGGRLDAGALLARDDDSYRTLGISKVKARYLRALGAAVAGGLDLHALDVLPDEQVIATLTPIAGIGVWTAEMFLIFALNRPDVLPVGDLGVRVGLGIFHGLPDAPKPRECPPLAEPWRPHRTLAMWYLWRIVEARGRQAVTV